MTGNFEQCLALVLRTEGGYVNNHDDPGGVTNLGVTKATWEAYVRRSVSDEEMANLGPLEVAPLYKQKYWDAVSGDDLPEGVDYCVFEIGRAHV